MSKFLTRLGRDLMESESSPEREEIINHPNRRKKAVPAGRRFLVRESDLGGLERAPVVVSEDQTEDEYMDSPPRSISLGHRIKWYLHRLWNWVASSFRRPNGPPGTVWFS